MLYFRSCQKCELGTVELREGLDGTEYKCVNCGFATEQEPERSQAKIAA